MSFHEGELAVQRRAGQTQIANRNGKIIADRMLPLALPFLAQQRMIVLGTRNATGALWSSLLFGEPGFARSEDAKTVHIDLDRAFLDDQDPLWSNLGSQAGLLVIDLATRKRYRINGLLHRAGNELLMNVAEAYPNCPKYITRRRVTLPDQLRPQQVSSSVAISNADLLFVASAHPERGADVSHRGGPRGFVKVEDSGTLLIPDYAGNGMFNTLGNLAVDPHAGLIIPDFAAGVALQLSGTAEVLWDESERSWRFTIRQQRTVALPAGTGEELLDQAGKTYT